MMGLAYWWMFCLFDLVGSLVCGIFVAASANVVCNFFVRVLGNLFKNKADEK